MGSSLKNFAGLLMIEQTLFALPFAWIGVLFAGGGTPAQWLWATLALVAARTAGMSFNRVLDAGIDAKNPRTAGRHLPAGILSHGSVWTLAFVSCAVLVLSSFMLNTLCFILSFVAIALLFTYSFFKRFSASSHYYLGIVEAAAPIGGYLAIRGGLDVIALLPGAAILFWIAGLDILYALQDMEFDRREGLHSIPARFGRGGAGVFSFVSYGLALGALVAAGMLAHRGIVYFITLGAVAFIFAYQQRIVRSAAGEYQRALLRVFWVNRFISPLLLAGLVVDLL